MLFIFKIELFVKPFSYPLLTADTKTPAIENVTTRKATPNVFGRDGYLGA